MALPSKGQITMLARLTALEYLVSHLLWMAARNAGDPHAELESFRRRVGDDLRAATLRGVPPEWSDMLMQETEEFADQTIQGALRRLKGT